MNYSVCNTFNIFRFIEIFILSFQVESLIRKSTYLSIIIRIGIASWNNQFRDFE